MKGEFKFSPELDWGPGTQSALRVLSEWASIDWFEQPIASEGEANQRLREHHTLASSLRPDLISSTTKIRTSSGSWNELRTLLKTVRYDWQDKPQKTTLLGRARALLRRTPAVVPAPVNTWDWKHGVLKVLSRDHWKAHAWSPNKHAHCLSDGPHLEGEIFLRLPDRDMVIFNSIAPKLDLASKLSKDDAALGQWYLNYAQADAIDCAAWQLAAGTDFPEGNPFVPLLRCYGAGYLPVALDPEDWVLFSFRGADDVNDDVLITPRGF